jgi:hypothetical protein
MMTSAFEILTLSVHLVETGLLDKALNHIKTFTQLMPSYHNAQKATDIRQKTPVRPVYA